MRNSNIKIDKGIPIPPKTFGRKRVYPVSDMDIGDSIFVEDQKSLAAVVSREKRTSGKKFTIRQVIENDVPGYRCWRIE